MPYDGSGNFTRSYNFTDDKNNGIRIVSSRMDSEFDNYATAMNQVLLRSGVVPMGGNLALGTYTVYDLGNGTVGAPAVRFNSDPTSGLYVPGVGKVALSAGGVNRVEANSTGAAVTGALTVSGAFTVTGATSMTGALNFATAPGNIQIAGTTYVSIDASGNVALGTLGAPTSALDVQQTSTNVSRIQARNTAVTMAIQAGVLSGSVGTINNTNMNFLANNSSKMVLTPGGFLGIGGATVPAAMLHVQDDTNAEAVRVSRTSAATQADMAFYTGGVRRGYVGADTTNNFGVYGDAIIDIGVNGATRARFDGSGRMGIGTTTLSSRLNVSQAASLAAFTGSIAGGAILVGSGDSTVNNYGVIDFTLPTVGLPLARIGMQTTGGGSYLHFGTSNSYGSGVTNTAMSIDPGGNVSVGNGLGAPISSLDIQRTGTTTAQITTRNAGVNATVSVDGTQAYIGTITNSLVSFITNNTERMRLSAAGELGVGKTPTAGISVDVAGRGAFVQNASAPTGAIAIRASAGDVTPGYLQWTNNANSIHLAHIVVDSTGMMSFVPNGSVALKLTASQVITDKNDVEIGYKDIPQNAQGGAYTLVLADRGKHIYATGGASALTIPPNSTTVFPIGSAVTIVNDGSGARTLTQGAGVTLKLSGTGGTGNRTLAVGCIATLIKVATDTWYVSGTGLA